jgi:hypothetical protein
MRTAHSIASGLVVLFALAACNDTAGELGGTGSGGNAAASCSAPGGPACGTSGATGTSGAGGTSGGTTTNPDGTPATGGGTTTTPDAGPTATAGNPNGSCAAGVPAAGQPASTATPTTVVGTGTAASCTFSQLSAAVTLGGIVTFDCGLSPVTIPVTATLNVPTTKNTVIDGGNKVTLDGQSNVRIMSFDSANFRANDNGLTLQHIRLINGKSTPTESIPKAPAPCSQGFNDGEGGAIYMRDGNLTIIDSTFTNNQAALLGPDTGGGAVYILGSKRGAVIVSSTFTGNKASNAGAVGGLFSTLSIYNSLFTGNTATGNGANSDDASKCSAINNGQHEVGSGGNGGAIYSDGASAANIVLCGDAILNNAAGVGGFGGGVFFTSNDYSGTLSITDSTMTGNTGGSWTNVASGSVTNAGTAVGTNAKSITLASSTLQGVP